MDPDSPLSSDPPPPPPPSRPGSTPPSPPPEVPEPSQFKEQVEPSAASPRPAAVSEWDIPPGQFANPASRASILLWVLAGVNLLFFGGCSAFFSVLAAMPTDWMRQMNPGISAEQIAQFREGRHEVWPWVVLMLLLGFAPGVVYLIVAFAVRRGRLMSINLAMMLVLTQAIVFGVLLLNAIAGSLTQGNPLALTTAVLILGTYVALLVYTLVWLWRARMGAYHANDEDAEGL